MDLRHLRELVVIGEELNVSRAAELPYLSQPAVSAHLSAVERHLGVRLFPRTGRGLAFTAGGERFVATVRKVLAKLDRTVEEARDSARHRPRTLTVGFNDNAAGELLGPLPGTELLTDPLPASPLDVGSARRTPVPRTRGSHRARSPR